MRIFYFLLIAAMLSGNSYGEDKAGVLNDEEAKLNYSVGYQIGSDFKIQNFEIRPDAILKGMQDAMSKNEALMTKDEMRQTMAGLGKEVAELKRKKKENQATKAKLKSKQFLLDNTKIPGVKVTDSGLQYRVIEQGNKGQYAELNDTVVVHYRGRLIDGTEFDSSYKRGKPASFKVSQVISGWAEALQIMPRGSTWQLVIPAELGYGSKGAGKLIPPDSVLVFDIDLISIK